MRTDGQGMRWALAAMRAAIGGFALAALAALALAAAPASAEKQSGGVNPNGTAEGGEGEAKPVSKNVSPRLRQQVQRANGKTVRGRKARLRKGLAIAPRRAPLRIKRVIWAANEIAKGKGYCWGGGHGRGKSRCYDCSGAVSYALRGGNFVRGSMPSSGYFGWGKRGRGKWLTVFTHGGHMYMTVAGLRFDTGQTSGPGPSWSTQMRSTGGFRARHRPRF